MFRQDPESANREFAAARGFGVFTANGPDGPLAAHAPFTVSEDGARVVFHLMRSNPLARALTAPQPMLLAVSGADAYISPDWYDEGPEKHVPTWNYVAVHVRGKARMLEDAALRPVLDALSAAFEPRLAPKTPWTIAKMDPAHYERLARSIQPAELRIERVEGTWKLGQNRTDAAREGAAAGIAAQEEGGAERDKPERRRAIGSPSAADIARLMRALPPQKSD